MSAKSLAALFVVLVAAAGVGGVESAPTAAPAPAVDCASLIPNMIDCLSFVSNGSTVNKPERGCCAGLKTVLKADAGCLCEAFKSSAQLGVVLNVSKAIALPSACHLSAPPLSECGLSIGAGPAHAPGMSPSAGGPTSLVPGGSEAAAPPPGSSGSSSGFAISVGSLVPLLLVSFFSLY